MIISRTPVRVSLAGGGTDLPEFYLRHRGAVTSFTIRRYVHVAVNRRFDSSIRISYSKTETVERVDQIEHALVRESLREFGIRNHAEITTMADIPTRGTGLGSSSSLMVGLVNVLSAARGRPVTSEDLARKAFYIERDMVQEPVGCQDHYIAAYGGIRHFTFGAGGVNVESVPCTPGAVRKLESWLVLCYTEMTRSASAILSEQRKATPGKDSTLIEMSNQAHTMRDAMYSGNMEEVGRILHDGWILKRSLTPAITNPVIDRLYQTAIDTGAIGGKLCGAGGGGFMLFCCPPELHGNLIAKLGLRCLPVEIEPAGSTVIYPHLPYHDVFG